MISRKIFNSLAQKSLRSSALSATFFTQKRTFAITSNDQPIKLTARTKVDMAVTRKMFAQVPMVNAERATLGLPPVINLTLGQPHVPLNSEVIKTLKQKLEEPSITISFGYSQTAGRPETLTAITKLYEHYHPKVTYANNEVMCTNGANQAIWNAFSILLEEKDGKKDVILTFSPYFVQYKNQVTVLGGNLKTINTGQSGWRPTAAALEQKIQQCLDDKENVKALIINYPNNPSGLVVDTTELKKMVDVLKKYPQIAIIQDDVYRDLSFKPFVSLIDLEPSFKDRTIVVNSASKGLIGAPDIRIGMAAAPKKWIEAMSTQQLLAVASISYLSQMALVAAIDLKLQGKNEAWEKNARETYQQNVQNFSKQLNEIGVPAVSEAEGAFYLLIDASRLLGKSIPNEITLKKADGSTVQLNDLHKKIESQTIDNDITMAAVLINMAGVATVPGSGFGLDTNRGILRISCAIDGKEFTKAIDNLKEVFELIDECQQTMRPGM